MWQNSLGNKHTRLLIPDGEPTTDQSTELGELTSFIGVIYKDIYGWGIIYRTRSDSKTAVTKAYPSIGDSSRNRVNLEHRTATVCRQDNRLECPLLVFPVVCTFSGQLCWFLLSGMVWPQSRPGSSSLTLLWSSAFLPLRGDSCLFTQIGRGLVNLVCFREFLRCLPLLRS